MLVEDAKIPIVVSSVFGALGILSCLTAICFIVLSKSYHLYVYRLTLYVALFNLAFAVVLELEVLPVDTKKSVNHRKLRRYRSIHHRDCFTASHTSLFAVISALARKCSEKATRKSTTIAFPDEESLLANTLTASNSWYLSTVHRGFLVNTLHCINRG